MAAPPPPPLTLSASHETGTGQRHSLTAKQTQTSSGTQHINFDNLKLFFLSDLHFSLCNQVCCFLDWVADRFLSLSCFRLLCYCHHPLYPICSCCCHIFFCHCCPYHCPASLCFDPFFPHFLKRKSEIIKECRDNMHYSFLLLRL